MLQQWRAGLRVSEALDLEVRDLSLDTATPTLQSAFRQGRQDQAGAGASGAARGALNNALAYGDISQGRLIEVHTTTAWRWVKTAVKRAEELGAICAGEANQHPHAAPAPRPPPADERHPHQLPVALAGALVDSDYAHIPGACAGPDGEPGGSALRGQSVSVKSTQNLQALAPLVD